MENIIDTPKNRAVIMAIVLKLKKKFPDLSFSGYINSRNWLTIATNSWDEYNENETMRDMVTDEEKRVGFKIIFCVTKDVSKPINTWMFVKQ